MNIWLKKRYLKYEVCEFKIDKHFLIYNEILKEYYLKKKLQQHDSVCINRIKNVYR